MNIANIKKYTIFIFVCFLSFISIALANEATPTLFPIKYKQTVKIATFEKYKNLSCSAADPNNKVFVLKKTTDGYEVTFANIPTSSGEFKVNCTYTDFDVTNELPFVFKYSMADMESEYVVTLDNYDESSATVDLGQELMIEKVISFKLDKGNEYLDINCSVGSSTCIAKISDNAQLPEDVELTGQVVYKPVGYDTEIKTKLTIIIYKSAGARAVPGEYGTCEFDTNYWEYSDGVYKSKGLKNIPFPDCKAKSEINPLLEFVGWVKVTSQSEDYYQTSNYCVSKNPQRGSFDVEPTRYYFACYRFANGIAVYPNGATVAFGDGWTKGVNGAYFKKGENGKVTLPNAEFTGMYNKDKEFKGWRKSSGDSTIYAAGTAVEADGSSYVAVYERTTTVRDYGKTIYVNENSVLKPTGAKVISCKSADESKVKVVSNENSHDCILQGVAKTETDKPIEVVVYGENEYQKTFYITVLSRYGQSEGSDNPFVVDLVPNIVTTYNDYTTLNGYQTDSCNNFSFTEALTGDDRYATTDESSGPINVYYLQSTCIDGQEYYALCLDAGRTSPEYGTTFARTEDIMMNSDFGRMLNYLATNGVFKRIKNKEVEAVQAANVVIRLVAILDNMSLSGSFNINDQLHADAYAYYEALAGKIKNITDKDGKIDASKVDEALSDSKLKPGVLNIVADVLKHYQTEKLAEGGTFSRTIDDVKYDIDGNNITITYTGTMTIPGAGTGITASLEGFSETGIVGTVEKWEINDGLSNEYNRTVYNYVVKLKIDATKLEIPSSSNQSVSDSAVSARQESKKISFKLTYQTQDTSISDAFIAEPSGTAASGSTQRLIAFNPEDVTLYIYFSPSVQSSACNKIPQLNPDNCMDESCTQVGDNGAFVTTNAFNASLFKASGCCNLLTDEQKYSYLIENVCSSTCTTTTMPAVCDYRPEYTGSADFYDVHEGRNSDGTYKLGGNKACTVYTDAFKGLVEKYETYTQKYDDSGNSIMVDTYKHNRYCRVSCSEDWQLSMDSFGNYVGKNAIAAGSYFAVNKNDMFIGGKRTCYTTFINYGSYEVEGGLGGFEGFTRDIAEQSDILVNAYNDYSLISHVYSDLAGGRPDGSQQFEEENAVGLDATHKYCTQSHVVYYCADENDVMSGTSCTHKASADETPSEVEGEDPTYSCDSWEDVRGTSHSGSLSGSTCSYTYDALKYNQCDAWGFCVTYSLGTSNGFNDKDKCPTGGGGSVDTAAGEYCKMKLDTSDGLPNASGNVSSDPTAYTNVNVVESGKFDELSGELGLGYAYRDVDSARAFLADDEGQSNSKNYKGDRSSQEDGRLGTVGSCNQVPGAGADLGAGVSVQLPPSNKYVPDDSTDEICDGAKFEECNTVNNGITPPKSFDSTLKRSCDGTGGAHCDNSTGKEFRNLVLETSGAEGVMQGLAGTMQGANNTIVDYGEDMFACQHFELYNTADSQENGMANNQLSTGKFMGTTKQFTRIVSNFSPSISYTYSETEYMTILLDDNIMERYKRYNASFFGEGCSDMTRNNTGDDNCYNNATNKKVAIKIKAYGNGSDEPVIKDVDLARNYLEMFYYDMNHHGTIQHQLGWAPNTDAAISYGATSNGGAEVTELRCPDGDCDFGDYLTEDNGSVDKRTILCVKGDVIGTATTVVDSLKGGGLRTSVIRDKSPFWTTGLCFITRVNYVQANYIKGSIENSSFYKNKGYWYINDSDVKEHGDNLTEALKNAALRPNGITYLITEEERAKWSILGDYNVFPIKMTTARNLYQYTYTFADIGSYSAGATGRIMGSDQSLISTNNRTCFYEVFEEICLCCGNPINSHVHDSTGIADPDEWAETYTPYVPSSKDYDPDNVKSTLAFNTSTVSLSDMKSDSDRDLGNNWSDNSLFMYDGNDFSTNKGAELLREIDSAGQGDNIYSETPEYSYSITPSGMALIREYNDTHGYEINHNNLTSVSRYSITPYDPDDYSECSDSSLSGCKWDVPKTNDEEDYRENRLISFQHYSSNFLNDFIPNNGTGITVKSSLYGDAPLTMSEECYVREGFTAEEMDDKQQTCRWVDYVQFDKDSGRYFRLSFK